LKYNSQLFGIEGYSYRTLILKEDLHENFLYTIQMDLSVAFRFSLDNAECCLGTGTKTDSDPETAVAAVC